MTDYFEPRGIKAVVNTITAGIQTSPRAVKLAGGGYVIVWEDRSASPDDTSVAIRGQLFTSSGTKAGAEFLVNTVTAGDQIDPSVGAGPNGGFLVTWTGSDSSGTGIKGQLFTSEGARSGGEFLVNTSTSDAQSGGRASGVEGLGYAVVWLDYAGTGVAVRAQLLDPGGNRYGSQMTVVANAAELISDLSVARLADGNSRSVVTYTQTNSDGNDSAVFAHIVTAGGSVGSAIRVSESAFGNQHDAAVALFEPTQGFIVAYVDEGAGGAVKVRIFYPDGRAASGDIVITADGSAGSDPSVVAYDSGLFAVSWRDAGGALLVQIVNGTGEKLGPPVAATSGDGSGELAALIPTGTESFLLVWANGDVESLAFDPVAPAVIDLVLSDDRIGEGIPDNLPVAQLKATGIGGSSGFTFSLISDSTNGGFAIDGGRLIVADSSRIDFETAAQAQVVIRATDSQGRFRDETHIIDIADAAIETPGWSASPLFAPNETAFGPTIPSVAPLSSGGFVMIYFDSSFQDSGSGGSPVRGRIYSHDGQRAGAEFDVPIFRDGNQHPVSVAGLEDGGFVVLFSDYREGFGVGAQLRAQVFDSAGLAVGGQVKVASVSGGHQSGEVAGLASGGFVVTFTNGWSGDVRAQIFDPAANKVGSEFQVPSSANSSQSDPAVAALEDGSFVILWQDSGNSLIAQRFEADGDRIGGNIPVRVETTDHTPQGSIAPLAGGGFVVTWLQGTSADPWNVVGRIFDSSGAPVGGMFAVHDQTEGTQRHASVTPLADGGFLVVWNDSDPGFSFHMPGRGSSDFGNVGAVTRAQMFDARGNKVGGAFSVHESFNQEHSYTAAATLGWGGVVVAYAERSVVTLPGTATVQARLFSPEAIDAMGDELAVLESGVAIGSVFADNGNGADSAPASGALMVATVNGASANVGKAIVLASGALLTLNADGTFTYDPNHAFDGLAAPGSGGSNSFGSDSFTYSLGGGDSATVNVTVTGEYSLPHVVRGTEGADLLTGTNLAETLVGGAGNDVYIVNDAGDVIEEDAGAGTDEIRTGLAIFSLVDLPNVENLTATSDASHDFRGNAGDNAVAGGDGNDLLRLHDGGDDIVNAGAGSDNIFFIGALTSADVVDGGDGVDTLILQGAYESLVLTANITQIENISILAGSNIVFGGASGNRHDYALTIHDSNFAAGVQARINGAALLAGEDFTFDGSAETDALFVVYGGKGTDTLTGGLGNDIFFYAEERFASGDTVNGGAGYDGMFLRGNYTIDFNAPGYTGLFTNIENLTLTSATDERYARGGGTEFDYNLTLSDAIVGAGQVLTVSGALLMATETMVLDASQEADGILRLFGGKASDTLKGGGQNDLIHGNLGADILTGNGGADAFRYQTIAESNSGSMDHILDFTPGTDRIELDRIDANTLVAGNQAFTWIGSDAFSGTAGELRAENLNNMGWFLEGDTDGNGTPDFVVMLTLQGPAPLSSGDFIL